MARENQGLQIALITFVMLTLVLSVTTFIFFKQSEEADTKAKAGQKDVAELRMANNNIQEENNEFKRLMGFPATQRLEEITQKFNEDMAAYAGTYPEEARFYSPVLSYLYKTIDDKLAEIDSNTTEIQGWKDKYAMREASKDPQIKEFQDAAEKAGNDLAKVTADFNERRESIVNDQTEVRARLGKTQKDSADALSKVETKLQDTEIRLQKLSILNKQKSKKLDEILTETFDVPDGEIRWVNQRNGTVWINLGQADSLLRQTTFCVYPADTSNLAKSGKKASIEITKILGPHMAEARVIEDEISDPIMPGDKIHTPVWGPGEQKHFALAGIMDVTGDGRSDLHIVRNLIIMSGGVVDCEINEIGKQIGTMSVGTRYLVLGKAPDEKSNAAFRTSYSRLIGDANRLGIKKISLAELLQKMGWKNQSPVVRFGSGANPNDFRAKPPDGIPRSSGGSVSELFKPRRPPAGRGSTY